MPEKLRVLLADDEPQVRAFVRAFLVAAHFEVVEASDGVHALEIIDHGEDSFDILITDIKMPRMDGITLARDVTSRLPHLPVLFISGYSTGPGPECAGVPRWDFLAKPFLPNVLRQRIAALLNGDGKARGSGQS